MRAKAFSPAHITGFFKAELEKKESNQLGSLGAGFSRLNPLAKAEQADKG